MGIEVDHLTSGTGAQALAGTTTDSWADPGISDARQPARIVPESGVLGHRFPVP